MYVRFRRATRFVVLISSLWASTWAWVLGVIIREMERSASEFCTVQVKVLSLQIVSE